MVLAGSASLATADTGCKPPTYPQHTAKEVVDRWDTGTRYQVMVKKDADKGKLVEYRGDTLRVTSTDFASLVRPLDQPRSDIGTAILDARELHLDSSLTFLKANVEFRGERIFIGPNATLSLNDTTIGQLTLVADEIVMDPRATRTFALLLGAKGEAMAGPRLTINARVFRVGDEVLDEAAVARLATNSSLDSFDDVDPPDPATRRLDVAIGAAGEAAFRQAFRERMDWPVYFAGKLMSQHAISPYDAETQLFLIPKAEKILPLLAEWRRVEPLLAVQKTVRYMRENRDFLGWAPEFVPRQNISSQRDELAQLDSAELSAYMKRLIDLIARDVTATEKTTDAEIQQLRVKRDTTTARIGQAQVEFNGFLTQAAQLEQQVSAVLESADQIRDKLRKDLDSMKKRHEDVKWVKPVAGVVAVVALLACQPEIAVPIAQGAQLIGTAVYEHNTSGQVDLGAALSQALAQSKALQQGAAKVKESWEQAQKANSDLHRIRNGEKILVKEGEKEREITKGEATRTVLQRGGDVAGALGELFKPLLEKPTPMDITLNTLEDRSLELKEKLREVERLRLVQKEALAKLKGVEAELTTHRGDVMRLEASLDDLYSGSVANDADRRRWREAASGLWTDALASAYRKAAALERSFFMLTGRHLQTPSRVTEIPLAQMAYGSVNAFDPLEDGARAEEEMDKFLTAELDKFLTFTRALVKAADDGKSEYLNNRFSGGISDYRMSFSSERPAASVERRVLNEINRLVEVAVDRARKGESSSDGEILIPIRWDAGDEPEYFLGAEVARVEHNWPSDDWSLRLKVKHPGYGILYRNHQCTTVDFRMEGAVNSLERVTTMPPFNPTQTKFTPDEVRQGLLGENFYTYLPARAPYMLSVSVPQPPSGTKKPVISRLDIKIHYFK